MKNKILKIIKWVVISILVIILILNMWIVIQTKTNPDKIPGLFGYKPFIVLSGSMETNINVRDLVVVKETDYKTLQKGDIIAFRDDNDMVTTHRIVEVLEEENDVCFKTKGDANNAVDAGKVCSSYIEGKYQFKVPKLGGIILFIQEPLGFTVLIMSIFIICILWYVIENRKIDKEDVLSEEEQKEFEEFKKEKAKQKNMK